MSCISLSSLFRPVVQFGPSSIRPHIHPCQFVSVRLVLLLSGPFGHFRLSDRLHLCRCCLRLHHRSSSLLSCLSMCPLFVIVCCSWFITISIVVIRLTSRLVVRLSLCISVVGLTANHSLIQLLFGSLLVYVVSVSLRLCQHLLLRHLRPFYVNQLWF